MPLDPILAAFSMRRSELLHDVSSGGSEIDRWLETHAQGESITELGELEGLFVRRRNILETLMTLDDEIMEHLIKRRSR